MPVVRNVWLSILVLMPASAARRLIIRERWSPCKGALIGL
jgi:hypothetical protein